MRRKWLTKGNRADPKKQTPLAIAASAAAVAKRERKAQEEAEKELGSDTLKAAMSASLGILSNTIDDGAPNFLDMLAMSSSDTPSQSSVTTSCRKTSSSTVYMDPDYNSDYGNKNNKERVPGKKSKRSLVELSKTTPSAPPAPHTTTTTATTASSTTFPPSTRSRSVSLPSLESSKRSSCYGLRSSNAPSVPLVYIYIYIYRDIYIYIVL